MALRLLLAPSIGTARARARAELLERSLGAALGEAVQIVTARDYDELLEQALGGGAELVWAPPSLCWRIAAHARRMFRCVRHGRSTYRSAILVRRADDGDLGGLLGKRAAWVDRLSLGGYLLAMQYLGERGFDPKKLFTEQRFVGSYPEAVNEVVYNKADVTAVSVPDGSDRSVGASIDLFGGKLHGDQLAAIAVTRETPNDALVLTDRLAEDRLDDLVRRLFGAADATPTASALCIALEAERFEVASADDYREVGALIESLS